MKIPNYDINNGKEKDKRVVEFIPEDFRLLISGQSRCGKTNLLMFLLRKPLVYYDQIYLYTPNHHQDKVQDLKKQMKDISKKVGYGVLEIGGQDDILNTNDYDDDNRKIIVFDDMINYSDKIQNKIANHFSDGRHHGISPIYLTQSYFDVPQKLRLNCSHMCLYPPTTRLHLRRIASENLFEPEEFKKLGPFEFLFVDKEKKTVKKNFI